LYVGGGIIITEKVNASKEIVSVSLKADSILMDSTKAFYGYSKFADDVKLESKLDVYGNVNVNGNLRTAQNITFAGNKTIGYLPASGGYSEILYFGLGQPPVPIIPCLSPVPQTVNQFSGMIQAYGASVFGGNINALSMGFDGSNGIIELYGTSNQPLIAPRLLINHYCGKDVFINTGQTGGDIQLTSSGNVGIGVFPATAKLDIAGNLKIGDIQEITGSNYVLVEDGNGLIGKKSLTTLGNDIGDGMGNHTAMQNIKLGDFWLSNSGDDKGLHIDQNGDLTLLLYGINSFEIKGNGGIPLRRGISLDEDYGGGTGGEFNFWINLWQDASFNFKGYIEDDGSGNSVTKNLMTILENGNVGIGTTDATEKLTVKGNILCAKVEIDEFANIPDYVFAEDYPLISLEELENYYKKYKHLPDVPSAEEFKNNPLDLGDLVIILLKKMEELTLYTVNQDKQILELSKENDELERKIEIILAK
jgi:hypothetical protein